MNVSKIVENLKDCPCGKEHSLDIKCVEIRHGVLADCANILNSNGFPKNILTVADENELKAADGILDILKAGGFRYRLLKFENLREASEERVQAVISAIKNEGDSCEGVLSIGSGSCNDICRRATYLTDKPFAIFATAPSMDGFASNSAPITENNFKITRPARQPVILMGDTEILACAPTELKSAGFGDMIAKCIGLADWRISALLSDEYYCEKVADITREAFSRICALADSVTQNDEQTAGAIMETLVLTGLAMQLAGCVRPASGAEHIVSHYWEIRKLEKGLLSDYHGRKVGLATLYISRLYHDIINLPCPAFHADNTDWECVYGIYGDNFKNEVLSMNSPTVTEPISPEKLYENWSKLCEIVSEEIPSAEVIENLLKKAGAPTSYEGVGISKELAVEGLQYHPYMRKRLTLARLLPMTDISPEWNKYIS